jgi:tetratricopeptide (TPR) repeat protein
MCPSCLPSGAQDASTPSPDAMPAAAVRGARPESPVPLTGHAYAQGTPAETDMAGSLSASDLARQENALRYYQQVLQYNPRDLRAMTGSGDIYRERGQHMQALACYQMALQVCPGDPQLAAAVELEESRAGITARQQFVVVPAASKNVKAQSERRRERTRMLLQMAGIALEVAALSVQASGGHFGMCIPSRAGLLTGMYRGRR